MNYLFDIYYCGFLSCFFFSDYEVCCSSSNIVSFTPLSFLCVYVEQVCQAFVQLIEVRPTFLEVGSSLFLV